MCVWTRKHPEQKNFEIEWEGAVLHLDLSDHGKNILKKIFEYVYNQKPGALQR